MPRKLRKLDYNNAIHSYLIKEDEVNMSEPRDQHSLRKETQAGTKRVYSKPEFRFESVFETRALSCGKVVSTQPTCNLNRKSS